MSFKNNKYKIIGLIFAIVLISLGVFVAMQIGPYNKNNKKDIIVDIPSGSTINSISNILYENELIKNKTMFKALVKVSNKASSIKAGKYLLNQSYSNSGIIDLLASGKIYQDGVKITIPEGSTSKEIVSILVNKKLGEKSRYDELINKPEEFKAEFEFLNDKGINSLEGFLYPDTYYFNEEDSEDEILLAMLKRFSDECVGKVQEDIEKSDKSLQEIITMASIVEKEAVLDEDRPLIASVFYNRIKIGMPLQSDATIQYIFEKRKKIVTYKDLKIDSPYNSYKNKGLPPTPIANPGIKSIESVLNPADTDYLYFVAKMDGGNNYSTNYQDHLKYVKEYKDERDKLNKK